MALPTAATPGYVTYPGVLYGPDVACSCLSRWLYLFRKLCVAKGYGDPVVWQLTGGNEASAGTHTLGGVFDLGGLGNARAMLARECGAVDWPRANMPIGDNPNLHTHGVIDCPHNERARYQRTACIVYRRDGLGYKGLAGPDPLPPPSKWRTYQEGIDWMKAELSRLNSPAAQEDVMTPEQEKKLDYVSAQVKSVMTELLYNRKQNEAIAGLVTADDAEKDGLIAELKAMIAAGPADTAQKVWYETTVRRGDQNVPVIQELANDVTASGRIEAAVVALGAVVDALPDSADVDAVKAALDALMAAHPKAEPQPEPVPALGIDVSKYQTTEQVVANLAGSPDFCIVNATTGLFSVSPALAANLAAARANADLVGFYHWSQTVNSSATTPDKSDPIGEARHFVSTAKPQPGDVLVLDHEEELGTWAQRVAYALAWLDEVNRLTGTRPLVYVNWTWIKGMRAAATQEQWDRLTSYPLWLSEPTGTPGQHSTVTAKDGSNEDDWPILVHQFATDPIDRDYAPDLNALKAIAVKKV